MPESSDAVLRRLERKLDALDFEVPAVEALAKAHAVKRPGPAPPEPAPRPPESSPVGAKVVAPPRPSKRRAAGAAVVVSLLLAWAGLRRWTGPAALHRAFLLPLSQSAGLSLKGATAYSADPARLLLYAIETQAGRVLSIRKFPSPGVSGLAWGANCLWSADAESGSIYQHDLDSTYSVRRVFANPERRPQALHWDGKALWVADAATETVYRYATGESLHALQQFALPGVFTAGIHVTGDVLWALDGWTRKVYRYRLKPIPVLLDVLETDAWLPSGGRVSGLAVEGSTLWIIAGSPEALHRFDLDRLRARRAPQGAAADWTRAPRGP